MASRDGVVGLAGGLDQDILQKDSSPTFSEMIDETLRDFIVTATFVNPLSLSDKHWDFGICFHSTIGPDGLIEEGEVVTVDSTGWCYYVPWPGGLAQGEVQIETFEPTPGATTKMDLWVVERTAIVGVNGRCRVPLELLLPARASSVAVGTGFDVSTRALGRKVGVRNFEVWPLE
jgi:hypothetical protein